MAQHGLRQGLTGSEPAELGVSTGSSAASRIPLLTRIRSPSSPSPAVGDDLTSAHQRLKSIASSWYVWPAELDLMGRLAGFDLEARHADWAGTAFTAESRSHVSVYRLTDRP